MRKKLIALSLVFAFVFILESCSKKADYAKTSELRYDQHDDDKQTKIMLGTPYRAAIGETFPIDVFVDPPSPDPIKISMVTDGTIIYAPQEFTLKGRLHQIVRVQVKSARTGLARLVAAADEIRLDPRSIDVGFRGQLAAEVGGSLTYLHPVTRTVSITDDNRKPFPLETPMNVELVVANGLLRTRSTGWGDILDVRVPPGSTAVPQFQISSQDLKGDPVHLSATLTTTSGTVLAHKDFIFPASPAARLTIFLAILGAFVHALYVYCQVDYRGWKPVVKMLGTSIVAGLAAWMFADFDLLGLKLNTNAVQTYLIAGFLFSYIGVDAIFGKRFGTERSNLTAKTRSTTPDSDPSSGPPVPTS